MNFSEYGKTHHLTEDQLIRFIKQSTGWDEEDIRLMLAIERGGSSPSKKIGTDEYIRDVKTHPIRGLDDRLLGLEYGNCIRCQHFDQDFSSGSFFDQEPRHRCAAFEDIPLEIWKGEVDHLEPYPDDNGFRFSANQ